MKNKPSTNGTFKDDILFADGFGLKVICNNSKLYVSNTFNNT